MKKYIIVILLIVFSACSKLETDDLYTTVNFEVEEPEYMNYDLIQEMEYFIGSGKYGAIHSVLAFKDNQCVFERYYNEMDKDSLNQLFTATPFVSSCMLGIAIDKGLIPNQDVPVPAFFSDINGINDIENKQDITLHHLLSQSSGIDSDLSWRENEDAYSMILNSPMDFLPGEIYNKDAGSAFLMGEIIKKSTEKSIDDFAENQLFQNLEIENWLWESDAHSNIYTDGLNEGLWLTSRDFAKIGLLYLNNGEWQNKQIVSDYWIKESMKPWMYMSYDFHQGYFCRVMNKSTVTPRLYGTSVVNINGLSQNMWLMDELNTLVLVTADKNASKDKLSEFLTHYMMPALFPSRTLEHNSEYIYKAYTHDTITIDGDLGEWIDFNRLIPENPERVRNTMSLSDYKPEIAVGWSRFRPTKILIAAKIGDDVMVEDQKVNDQIEISLDLQNTGRTYKWVFSANGTFYGDVATSENTLFEVQKGEQEYFFEIEIDLWEGKPIESDLRNFYIEPGTTIGLKVNCTDVDEFAELGTVLGWSTDDEQDFLFTDYNRPALFGSVTFIDNNK